MAGVLKIMILNLILLNKKEESWMNKIKMRAEQEFKIKKKTKRKRHETYNAPRATKASTLLG